MPKKHSLLAVVNLGGLSRDRIKGLRALIDIPTKLFRATTYFAQQSRPCKAEIAAELKTYKDHISPCDSIEIPSNFFFGMAGPMWLLASSRKRSINSRCTCRLTLRLCGISNRITSMLWFHLFKPLCNHPYIIKCRLIRPNHRWIYGLVLLYEGAYMYIHQPSQRVTVSGTISYIRSLSAS